MECAQAGRSWLVAMGCGAGRRAKMLDSILWKADSLFIHLVSHTSFQVREGVCECCKLGFGESCVRVNNGLQVDVCACK